MQGDLCIEQVKGGVSWIPGHLWPGLGVLGSWDAGDQQDVKNNVLPKSGRGNGVLPAEGPFCLGDDVTFLVPSLLGLSLL